MVKRTTTEGDGEKKAAPARYGDAAFRSPGSMSPRERAELIAVAEELRERHIDAAFFLRKLFIEPIPPKRRGRKPRDVVKAFRDEQQLERYNVALLTLHGIYRGDLQVREPATYGQEAGRPSAEADGDLQGLDPATYGPYLEAVEAYRKSGRGEYALEARAAMLAFNEPDPDEALKRLGSLRAAVNRARAKRPTE